MTEIEQRIAIAEACGWSGPNSPRTREQVATWTKPEIWMTSPNGEIGFITDCPDYLNDLNAMHEAEKILTDEQYEKYRQAVVRINFDSTSPVRVMCPITATAAQRAEAFLKAMKLDVTNNKAL